MIDQPSAVQRLIVRDARVSDIAPILAIKRDPNVAKMQTKFDEAEYASFLANVLNGDNVLGVVKTQYTTIEEGGTIIGYVRHDHYSIEGTKMVECSFNLASPFWGQGRMKIALKHLLDQWIGVDDVHHVFADHFRTNVRCEALLTGLLFDRQAIPILERLRTIVQQRCLQWIIRRRLDADRWRLKSDILAPS